MGKPKLFYFNARGRAETVRYLLAVNGIDYEDVRFEREQWPEYKAKSPYGTAPYLETEDGDQIGQTCAIERYFVEKYGLEKDYSPKDKSAIDVVVEQVRDIFEQIGKIFFAPDEAGKKAALEKYKSEKMAAHFGAVKKMISNKYPGVTRGEKVTTPASLARPAEKSRSHLLLSAFSR